MKKLSPHSPPTEYSDFSDSISHINHANHLSLFQNDTDTAITISGDGAQLTMKKQSDVWVLIVTILNLPPNIRSKATNIIIPLIIPEPHSPGNVESFVYALYEELAKLSVGIWTWDALLERYFVLKVYLCGVLGDMLGSAKLSKMAEHMALHGCHFSTVQGAHSSANKGVSQAMASMLGAEAESAIATLPSAFSGPIRDPYKKHQSQYKIYDWMALLHWYIVSISWELGFNLEVVKNFALFSNVVEYAMTTTPRIKDGVAKLYGKIVDFLKGFEHLYVGNEPSSISCCRLCIFQLIHVPHHIFYNGSVRFGSQATFKRAIEDIGHDIRSKKSPFKNIVSYKAYKLSARLLHLSHPALSLASARVVQRTALFKVMSFTQKQRRNDDELKAEFQEIQSYLGSDLTVQLKQWGKCPLSNNITLTSQLFETSKKVKSCTSRYFEAQPMQGLQPIDQPVGVTELKVERTKPIFGEAIAFYTVESTGISVVVYHPLIKHQKLFGRWYGEWSPALTIIMFTS